MTRPIRLSHAVLKTYDVERLRRWYCDVLEARVAFEQLPMVSFITYDEEHHRLGIAMQTGEPTGPDPRVPGLAHLAFTYANITDLLNTYDRVRKQGIEPRYCVNHGPTISIYYDDPDGNGVELLIDRFTTAEEAQGFIDKHFAANPIGVEFRPSDKLEALRRGVSEEELCDYDATLPIFHPPYEGLAASQR
jgi:catechol-2,3-dioxygenase